MSLGDTRVSSTDPGVTKVTSQASVPAYIPFGAVEIPLFSFAIISIVRYLNLCQFGASKMRSCY